MATQILVNIGSGNGLLCGGTRFDFPLLWSSDYPLGQTHERHYSHQPQKLHWKPLFENAIQISKALMS